MKKRWKPFFEAIKMEVGEHKSSFTVYVLLCILVILILIAELFSQNYENVFLCLLTLLLLIIPSVIQVEFKIELPTTLEIILLLFVFCAEILGETQSFYLRFPMWDTLLHTLNGFIAAAIGFSLVDLMNRHPRIHVRLSPLFVAIVAFCFSMTIGVVWEFFEFFMDRFAGLDMQKDTIIHSFSSVLLDSSKQNIPILVEDIWEVSVNGQPLGVGGYIDIGLIDTMSDLLVNFIGALLFSTLGYFYVKNRGKGTFVKRFLPRRKDKKHDYKELAIRQQERSFMMEAPAQITESIGKDAKEV